MENYSNSRQWEHESGHLKKLKEESNTKTCENTRKRQKRGEEQWMMNRWWLCYLEPFSSFPRKCERLILSSTAQEGCHNHKLQPINLPGHPSHQPIQEHLTFLNVSDKAVCTDTPCTGKLWYVLVPHVLLVNQSFIPMCTYFSRIHRSFSVVIYASHIS